MAWSVLAHTIATRATTTAIDTTGADLLVVAVSSYSTTPVTVSDSKSNTWSPRTEKASGNNHTRLFFCQGGTVGSAHTFSTNADFYDIAVAAFSGSGAIPFDVENGAAAVASALATGSITPAVNGELIVSALGETADGGISRTYSVDSGLTITDQNGAAGGNHNGLGLAYFAQTTAAAINPTWSITGGANNIAAVIASFKPAAGGGGITADASITEAGDTKSAAATVAIAAAVSVTEASDTVTAAAALAITAAAASTEASDSSSAAGTLAIAAVLAKTEASDSLSAQGGTPATVADLSITEAGDSIASAGAVAIAASASASEAADSSSAAAVLKIIASASTTEAADSLSADANSGGSRTADADIDEASDSLSSSATNTTPVEIMGGWYPHPDVYYPKQSYAKPKQWQPLEEIFARLEAVEQDDGIFARATNPVLPEVKRRRRLKAIKILERGL